jgi:hypothetical protein
MFGMSTKGIKRGWNKKGNHEKNSKNFSRDVPYCGNGSL